MFSIPANVFWIAEYCWTKIYILELKAWKNMGEKIQLKNKNKQQQLCSGVGREKIIKLKKKFPQQ